MDKKSKKVVPLKGTQKKSLLRIANFSPGNSNSQHTPLGEMANFKPTNFSKKLSNTELPLILYKKYQEKAKLPLYTTYSKADWSQIRLVTIGLANANRIRQWAERTLPSGKVVGEVTNANTLHHKTFKPIKGGLFCERIFGPLKDFECACRAPASLGKKIKKLKKQNLAMLTKSPSINQKAEKEQNLQKLLEKKVLMSNPSRSQSSMQSYTPRFFCPQCDVEYTWSVMRRYQLGYINLNSPIAHVWYLKSSPNYISVLLDMKRTHLLEITYCTETLTLENSLKSSAEVLTNVADTYNIMQSPLNQGMESVNRSASMESATAFMKDLVPKKFLTSKGIVTRQNTKKKNTYYFSTGKYQSNLKPGVVNIPGRQNQERKINLSGFSEYSLEYLVNTKLRSKTNLVQKYVSVQKSLADFLETNGFCLYSTFDEISLTFSSIEIVANRYPEIYRMRKLARCKVVMDFLQNSCETMHTSYSSLTTTKSSLGMPTLLRENTNAQKSSYSVKQSKTSCAKQMQYFWRYLASETAKIGSSLKVLNTDAQHLTNFETFCRVESVSTAFKKNKLTRSVAKIGMPIIKENLRKAYVMEFEASLSLGSQELHKASHISRSSMFSLASGWKNTLTLVRFSDYFKNRIPGAREEVLKNNVTNMSNLDKMVDSIWFLVTPTHNPFCAEQQSESADFIQVQCEALTRKALILKSNNKTTYGNLTLVEKVYFKNSSRLLFIKKLLMHLFANTNSAKYVSKLSTLQVKQRLCLPQSEQKSSLIPKLLVTLLTQKEKPYGDQISGRLVTQSHFEQLCSQVKYNLGSFINQYALRNYKVVMNTRPRSLWRQEVLHGTNLVFDKVVVKKSALVRLKRCNYISDKKGYSRLILSYKFLNTFNTVAEGFTKRFLQSQKSYKFDSRKTIVNNIYCFSHRVLWNHAVDWQFFSLYYFSFKAINSKINVETQSTQYNNTSVRKTMSNLEDINVPVYSYRNYDFSLLNTFFSQDFKTNIFGLKDSRNTQQEYKNKKKFNFTQELEDKQNLHINYSGAGILKTLLSELDNNEIRTMYKQNVMILFALNRHMIKTKNMYLNLLLCFSKDGKIDLTSAKGKRLKSVTGEKPGRKISAYKKELKELAQQRELLIGKIKLLRKLFSRNSNSVKRQTIVKKSLKAKQKTKSRTQNESGRSISNKTSVYIKNSPMPETSSIVLTVLPVLPPDLRPIVKMGNQIAASDLNRFYQRILYRNDRLKRFLKDAAINGSYEMKYAQRLLQEAVDNLIQNGKSGVTPEKDARGRLLKSLSDILKGKQGRFRQYLLGKRVDYSGRSVIVVGPSLKLHECGIPKEMALELFLPFLIKRILSDNYAKTVIGAKTLIKNVSARPLIWELLREILKSSPVLLNRAPTLHRLGFQAFQPKLVDGRAILLHPLVCPAFNADFDGDQMAVHVPISPEARAEAWKLMLSRNNLLSPATGEPLVLPSQDMVLGCYYLTTNSNFKTQQFEKGYGLYFNSLNEVLHAYQQGVISIHAIIWVKWNGKVENSFRSANGNIEEPAEIRLNQYGGSHVIYSRSYSTFHYLFDSSSLGRRIPVESLDTNANKIPKSQKVHVKGVELVNNIIRTTPGKILFNIMIGMALNPSNSSDK